MTIVASHSASIARADDPPGDCWNEALSEDKLHCYFLEEAQRAGEIEVAAVYVAPGGGPLYIFLEQTTPITDEVAQLFEAKAHEYMERVSPTAHRYTDQCGGHTGDERKDCFNSFLDHPKWRDFESHLHFSRAVPRSNIYERIVIDVGGSDGRRKVPGWASWRQVWPPVAPGPGGSSGFDVSDVDLTNIPDPDCETDFPGINFINQSCHNWQDDPSLGIAGVYDKYKHDVRIVDSNDRVVVQTLEAVYVQLKVSDPDDEKELQALVDRLPSGFSLPGVQLVALPVKYDFGELWRWSVILDRFALSAGNTVGITHGAVAYNSSGHNFNDEPLVWMNGVEPLRRDGTGSGDDLGTVRTILTVWAVDPHLAAEALPELLPELGIPADAVGVVKHDNTTPVILTHAAGSGGTTSRLRSAVGRVGVNSDGMPISIDTTSDYYPPTDTRSVDVQSSAAVEPEGSASSSGGGSADVTGIKTNNIAGIWPRILTGAAALAVLCAAILIILRIRLRRA